MTLADATPETASADFDAFRRRALALTGVDLSAYKVPQMQRRLGQLLTRAGVETFAEYAALLARDAGLQQQFRDFVTINVSEFFRDPTRFADLERQVLPALLHLGRALRAWSAGCSIGAEPYSLAIALRELAPGAAHVILATDIDETILSRARRGQGYGPADLRAVSAARLARWFTGSADEGYAVRDEIRHLVRFQRHDLVRDVYPAGPFDLILCRNVVIYFTEAARDRVYHGFVQRLRPGGMLFIGGTEVIMRPRDLGVQALAPGFYRKAVA